MSVPNAISAQHLRESAGAVRTSRDLAPGDVAIAGSTVSEPDSGGMDAGPGRTSALELRHYDEAMMLALERYPPLPPDAPALQHHRRTIQAQVYRDLLMQAWVDPEHARAIREGRQRLQGATGRDRAAAADHGKTENTAVPALRWRTARDIAESTSEAVPWIAAPWLAAGAMTEVDGKIKSGKTTLMLHLLRCILDGLPFLGVPTVKGKVVVLTEQNDTSFRAALGKADLLDREDLLVLSHHDVRRVPWPVVVECAGAKALEIGATVLVVDTFGPWAQLAGDAENDAGASLEAVAPLMAAAAQRGLAVVLIRHERKSSGNPGDAARGSSAIGGSVDVIVAVRPGDQKHPNRRKLLSVSRFSETPAELMIELTETGYVVPGEHPAGNRKVVRETSQREQLFDALPADRTKARTVTDLVKATGISRPTVQTVLKRMHDDGAVGRYQEPKGKTCEYRYHRAAQRADGVGPTASDSVDSVSTATDVATLSTLSPPLGATASATAPPSRPSVSVGPVATPSSAQPGARTDPDPAEENGQAVDLAGAGATE